MNNMLKNGCGWFPPMAAALSLVVTDAAEPPRAVYQSDFSKAEIGKVPDDFLVLDGQFAVQQDGDNRFLELPGAPLDTFGVLFGPTESAGLVVSARVYGTAKGRRFPTFAVSLNGVSGYRLQVTPGKKQLELFRGDQVLASAPFVWETGHWTQLKLQVRKLGSGECRIQGKTWRQDQPDAKEPDAWMISYDEKTEPTPGRAGVWGSPFSGTPIRFDDLVVARATENP